MNFRYIPLMEKRPDNPLPVIKTLRTVPQGNRIIRADAWDTASQRYRTVTFEQSRIDYITQDTNESSYICLKSGAKISVPVPHAELEKKIYTPEPSNDPILDIRRNKELPHKTGPQPTLSGAFQTQVEKNDANEPLTITAFIGVPKNSGQTNYMLHSFKETEIIFRDVSSWNKGVHMPLKNGKSPFGEHYLWLNMSHDTFTALYTHAKSQGQNHLDLRDASLPEKVKNNIHETKSKGWTL
ncbi:MAG: hypothetical protein OXT65_02145 [Alphaproteobacteria bacterium]|nr:hypothetical protein [Alphaproteobacteria bacterium]